MTSVLEATMLVCFGFSWPINLIKNLKAKTAKSMSLKFLLLIIIGYIAGIAAKLINHNINYVLAIYFLNLAIVSVNLVVYFINKRYDKLRAEGKLIEPFNAEAVVDKIDCVEEIQTIETIEQPKSKLDEFDNPSSIDFYTAMNL